LNTGQFEGQGVFQAQDPGGAIADTSDTAKVVEPEPADAAPAESEAEPSKCKRYRSGGYQD